MNNKKRLKVLKEGELGVVGEELGFAANEAYKKLRTNIFFSFSDTGKSRIIGITSSIPGEGKSMTSINLSNSVSLVDKKVLLLEADLRKPTICKKLNFPNDVGLSNYLVGEIKNYREVICPKSEKINFDIMPAGKTPPNPSELLGSNKMKELAETLLQEYDYIIVDFPPVGIVSDPLTFVDVLDGMILVVRHNYTAKPLVKDSVKQLEYSGIKILGYVYSGTPDDSDKRYKRNKRYHKYY